MAIASNNQNHGDDAGSPGGMRLLAVGVAVLLVVGAVVALATWNAIGDNDVPHAAATTGAPESSAPPEPTASSTLTPEEAAAVQEILTTYRAAIQAQVAAVEAGDPDHPDLNTYWALTALSQVKLGIERNNNQGTYYRGDLRVLSVTVTELNIADSQWSATIESCLDDTDYRLVRREGGSPVSNTEPGGRYSVTSRAFPRADGGWYIVESIAHWDKPC